MPRDDYPQTVNEGLSDRATFHPACLRALRAFRRSKPWRGTVGERIAKFRRLHAELCMVYGLWTTLAFRLPRKGEAATGNGIYSPARDEVVLIGRLSVI